MSEWPLDAASRPVDPDLKEKWEAFLDECAALGSEVRNVEYCLYQKPTRVFVIGEVRRLGGDYGDVYWHGNLDDKDSWGTKLSDDDDDEEVHTKARPDSPYSDRGLDKIDWFRVTASTGDQAFLTRCVRIHQGMCYWDEDKERYFDEKGAYYYHEDVAACMPLAAILRLPGPGMLAYEWVGTQNPLWH